MDIEYLVEHEINVSIYVFSEGLRFFDNRHLTYIF